MTQINYSHLLTLSGGTPNNSTVISVNSDTTGAISVSFTGAFAASGDTVTLMTPSLTDLNATFTGLSAPDGDPIITGSDGTNYALDNGSNDYSQGSSFTPINDPVLACFAAGTRILTGRGEVPVEELQLGDRVPTLVGRRMSPIRWIGHTRVDCRRHARPWDVNPVTIMAGAFGPGLPLRDVTLSPDHSVFVDGALVPIRYLVNHATIRQTEPEAITYWHVELERHDALFAEGLPAESYLDTGNRHAFAEAPIPMLHPDFRLKDRAIWDREACAKLVESGPQLDAIRARLEARAAALGAPVAAAFEIDIGAVGRSETVVPAGSGRVRLVSPCLVPNGESRRLGACIATLALDGVALPLDAAMLAAGFHGIETRNGQSWRWTNGDAILELPASAQARRLAIDVQLCVALPGARAA